MSPLEVVVVLMLVFIHGGGGEVEAVDGTWCVVRSDANLQALQTGLDYACGSGADCGPIQPSGLCYLPNTVQAHASYAFNSYFQRKSNAPGSCDFSGTATLAKTEPSYGSCVFPSNPSTAGGTGSGNPMTTNPGGGFGAPPPPLMGMTNQGGYGGIGGGGGSGGVTSPFLGPPIDDTNNANIATSSITILAVSLCSYIFLTFQQRCLDIWHW
ncbi:PLASMODESMATA CALLOSE-BINDING PROTEIN 3-like [Impatiens glandulifera]|uniref:PLASMODESMATA CALLOSE-BINDING PROTEIN 3-like n=1 Tax=Impatiens glandulifera TaxID=253017 RepID=UPI001FB10DBC|nr:PLASMODESMATA CALLOSE-BINDING PROTEIN 3-like [Impatiens glandulifera]